VIYAESVKNPVSDVVDSAKGFLQLRSVDRVPGIEGAGDLVDVIPDAPGLAEKLAERPVVGGRAPLGAGSGIAVEGSCPEESAKTEAAAVSLGGDLVKFIVDEAEGKPLVPLSLFTARRHNAL
jgi:hypothetical protein